MKHKVLVSVIVACFMHITMLQADEVITFFLKPYPEVDAQGFASKLPQTGKVARRTLKNAFQQYPMAGLFASYAGYLNNSNSVGQITFPRRHEAKKLHILITQRITPIIMAYNTIDHWEIEVGTPAQMYNLELKKSADGNLSFWDVKKVPLPKDGVIPLDTIILFAKPEKNIVIPEGITITQETSNLVLPDVYLKKAMPAAQQALYLLNLRLFFGQLGHLYKKQAKSYESHIDPY